MIERVEFFGDSIVRGALWADGKFRLRPGRDFPELSGLGLTVRNNAMIGASIVKGAKTVERRLPALDDRTLVVMGFGGNDCNFDWQAVADAPDDPHLPVVLLQSFRERYARLIAQARGTVSKVALLSLVPLDADKFFAHISEGRSAEAILHWLGDKEILYRWHENYNRTVERLAASLGCALIDVRDGFLTRHDFATLIGEDGIHPTEAGYRIIDEIIDAEVEDLVAWPAMA
ncbi:MAG: SGNH/GDSL hydrolase family protein [Eggerthellaceae bacterium]|nr:SGNH/GDSL hydrolase family protein [Eggerthellaceae bacterium]